MAPMKPYYYMQPDNIIAAAVALSLLDIIVVALRFWTRKIQRQPPKADDWLMVPAALLTVGVAISQIYGVSKRSIGYRTDIPPGYTGSVDELVTPQITLKSQIEWAFFLMLPIALCCIKTSFLCFYRRVFSVQKRDTVDILLKGSIVFVVLWTIAFFFAVLFQCGTQFWAIWNSEAELKRRCTNTINMIITLCITDFITDLVIIIIPIPLVLRLNLNTTKKIGVCAMFLLGGGILVSSLVRFVLMAGSFMGGLNITDDNILGVSACLYWGMVECGVGVFAACLPTIQYLVRKFVFEPVVSSAKSIFSSRSSRHSSDFRRDGVHIEKTVDVSYKELKDDCLARPESSVIAERVTDHTYDVRDERVGAFV
ncbi:uncharacterized protein F4822DRAFT_190157 [Hypoxylon trugodes]|uniref:uncharacterized protein n=1 Tax=Hypoxylon trugodes TaxID=326681 RepID=UPI002196322E|nr:uncharacterized protein F4822DRAFT_190157 [Hypoxylon trugodes]KAI1391574.1 hypothetical protein F4822DRAFT_190157 [Hypoxylon trugodes]